MKFRKLNCQLNLLFLSILSLLTVSCKEGVVDPHLTVFTTENLIKLQAAADNVITKYNAPGLVAYISVAGEGELFITRGVSNLTTSEPMNPASYFRIACITKTFITEAVLILADEGKIDLNKSISSYLPELKIPSDEIITIRMLGNMTSGLFDYSKDPVLVGQYYQANGEKIYSPEELVAESIKHPLNFIPGSKYEYSNTNTVILGLLIKKVTGKTVDQILSDKIFQPLGMATTYWPHSRFLPYPYSHGYSAKTGSLLDVTNWSPSWRDAAGILISNFFDLNTWVQEIYESNLLSEVTKGERFKWVDQDGSGKNFYGFGLMKFINWIGHTGIIEGYNSVIFYNPEKQITIIAYTNCDDNQPAVNQLLEFVQILDPY